MKRAISVIWLVLLTLVAWPRSAEADLWDFLQEFSGPGPFHTDVFNLMLDLCPQQKTEGRLDTARFSTKRFLRDFETPGQLTTIQTVSTPAGTRTVRAAYPYQKSPNGYEYYNLTTPSGSTLVDRQFPNQPVVNPSLLQLEALRGYSNIFPVIKVQPPVPPTPAPPAPPPSIDRPSILGPPSLATNLPQGITSVEAFLVPLPAYVWRDSTSIEVPIQNVPKPRTSVCLFVDYRRFSNDDKDIDTPIDSERTTDNFGAGVITLRTYEAGLAARLHRSITLGFGLGLMKIHSVRTDTDSYKPLLAGPRVVIRPFLLYGSEDFWNRHPNWYYAAGSVKYYFKENIVIGRLTGEDFGVARERFDVRFDRVASTGFVYDASDAVTWLFQRITRRDDVR